MSLIETINNQIVDIETKIIISQQNADGYLSTKTQFNNEIDELMLIENNNVENLNLHLSNLNQIKTILQNQ
jgi:hypothetical protein